VKGFGLIATERVDEESTTRDRFREVAQPFALSHPFATLFVGGAIDELELAGNARATYSIFCQAAVPLEVQQTLQGVGPEDAIRLASFKSKSIEGVLEGGNIVAAHHWQSVIEKSVAESVPGFDENPPCLRSYDAVGGEALGALELTHRRCRGLPVLAGMIGIARATKARQPQLNVDYGFAGRALVIQPHDVIVAEKTPRGGGFLGDE
jgi:hypothetical protein